MTRLIFDSATSMGSEAHAIESSHSQCSCWVRHVHLHTATAGAIGPGKANSCTTWSIATATASEGFSVLCDRPLARWSIETTFAGPTCPSSR